MKSGGYLFIFLMLFSLSGFAVPLSDVYQAAQPGAGFDRVLQLEAGEVYTGSQVIFGEKVAIRGNGAIIDLQGGAIIAIGSGLLDIDGCVLINGSDALSIADNMRTTVSNCVFYGNTNGIQHTSYMAPLKISNSIFMNQQNTAVSVYEENLVHMEYNVAYNNSGGHFLAGCGS
ncbi:MAG: right-handed parallel beta-helix repeat-containing protein [Calditrichia bacterium]